MTQSNDLICKIDDYYSVKFFFCKILENWTADLIFGGKHELGFGWGKNKPDALRCLMSQFVTHTEKIKSFLKANEHCDFMKNNKEERQ